MGKEVKQMERSYTEKQKQALLRFKDTIVSSYQGLSDDEVSEQERREYEAAQEALATGLTEADLAVIEMTMPDLSFADALDRLRDAIEGGSADRWGDKGFLTVVEAIAERFDE